MSKQRFYRILGLLSFVTVIWGLNVIMIKYLSGIFPVIQLGAWRIAVAAVCLLVFTWGKWLPSVRSVAFKGWVFIFLAGFSSIFLHQLLVSEGLKNTTGSAGSLILGLNPLTTALLAMMFMGDRFELRRFIGIGLGFFGVMLVVGHPNAAEGDMLRGNLFVFLSMLAYVAGGLLIKQSVKYANVFIITTFSHVFGAILLLIMWLVYPVEATVTAAPRFAYLVMIFSGAVATALCTTWWNMAISEIGPSKTTLFLNVMPISSLIFASIFLNEAIHWYHSFALVLIVFGIYLGLVPKKQLNPVTAASVNNI
jgi:drug/metabolite transporter (DMT)-like permease